MNITIDMNHVVDRMASKIAQLEKDLAVTQIALEAAQSLLAIKESAEAAAKENPED